MAKKEKEYGEELERAAEPIDMSPAIVALRAAEQAAAELKANQTFFDCVCGNRYPEEEFKFCPRCQRPKVSANRSSGEQDGSQNF